MRILYAYRVCVLQTFMGRLYRAPPRSLSHRVNRQFAGPSDLLVDRAGKHAFVQITVLSGFTPSVWSRLGFCGLVRSFVRSFVPSPVRSFLFVSTAKQTQPIVFSEGVLFLDDCDFTASPASVLVYSEGDDTPVIRNIVLGNDNCE